MNKPGGVVEKERSVLVGLEKFQRAILRRIVGKAVRVEPVGIVRSPGGKPSQPVGLHWNLHASLVAGKVEAMVEGFRVVVVVLGDVPLA